MLRYIRPEAVKYADLHFHSTASDGKYSPAHLGRYLTRKRIAVASLTDHDTVKGFLSLKKNYRGIAIPGVELSVMNDGHDIHILGYGFDPENPLLNERLNFYRDVRYKRIFKIIERLQELGVHLKSEDVEKNIPSGASAGRPHIARALVTGKWVGSESEAFNRYLDYDKPAYVPKAKMTFSESLELIHQARGIAILAHPGKSDGDSVRQVCHNPDLDGIEVWHPNHNESISREWLNFTRKTGRVATGGSDFHASAEGKHDTLGEFGLEIGEWILFKKRLIEKETFISRYL